ncbi:vanadium-dependent haloperoxidase [Micromonospora sp. C31]|uniref:vanadium-dependent haloperoxidase n=1 Tax=Micromonospora sp. C31 TaxID=2824876 RepID=UPI001B380DD6|nr:vanadium-dependent haloperoxidase [Micromonospora sp. C31]MBQ1072608.1 vanadium-dependent haloperoxidase [Micromonospora sp. C31]
MNRRGLLRVATALIAAAGVGASIAGVPQPAAAAPQGFDHVVYWNDVLLNAFRASSEPPTVLSRAGAMMHLAMYDTAVSLGTSGAPYIAKVNKIPNYSYDRDWNMDAAAVRVLRAVFPGQNFDTAFTGSRAYPPVGVPGPEGWSTSVGDGAAQNILNARANDGSGNNAPYPVSNTAGQWRPTGSGAAVSPNWGSVTPFALTSGSQFRPSLPGGFTTVTGMLSSTAYANQVNEVRRVGSATAAPTDRTADQTQLAFFWANDLNGTYKPPGQLFEHTQIVAAQRPTETVRLFALVAMAMADAGIAAWDAKYNTGIDLWRPESAIAEPQSDGNPATTPDASWRPLSVDRNGNRFSPPFPAYVSGHATFAGAWAGVMKRHYGTDAVSFVATTEDPMAAGATRAFSSFSAAATENARSRVYLGVHYQWDADAGLSTGDGVANRVFSTYLR